MIQLNYYYQTDLYQVSAAIANKLQFDHFDSQSYYGTGLILNLNNKLLPINKNTLLEVKLESLDEVLIVKNFEDLLTVMNNTLANNNFSKFGKTLKFGDKYVKTYVLANSFKALKINQDNMLIIFDKQIINTVKIYAE